MASTEFHEASQKSFKFDAIGVAIALQPNIPNLFRISTVYLLFVLELALDYKGTKLRHLIILKLQVLGFKSFVFWCVIT